MKVTVGGIEYDIFLSFGNRPVWDLIGLDGKPMTRGQFENLPEADRLSLFEMVQKYQEVARGQSSRQHG